MPALQTDLEYLRLAVENLKAYLLSDILFWPIGGQATAEGGVQPSLTLGGLLLARARVLVETPETLSETDFRQLVDRVESLRLRWGAAWEKKAQREHTSRLHQWRNYLMEYRRDPENHADFYAQEVKNRVRLELLSDEISGVPEDQRELLRSLDQLLRGALIPGKFVWESGLENGFPRTRYWFLYGRPRKS